MFQRMVIVAFGFLFIFNMILLGSLCLYLLVKEGTAVPLEKLVNHEKYKWMNDFYPAVTLAAVSTVIIYNITQLRYELQYAYFLYKSSSSRESSSGYLNLRTVEIESTYPWLIEIRKNLSK